jgi:Protein of unknown function (DUF1571)
MIKAKERVGRPSCLVLTIAGLSLSFLDLGCAGMSGFRSVGTERPSLLGFLNPPQAPSPTPSNDLYARNMRGAAPTTALAARQSLPAASTTSNPPTTELATVPASGDSGSAAAIPGDKSIRVTLGRPEPLRSLPKPPTATEQVAAKLTPSPAKTSETPEAVAKSNELASLAVAKQSATARPPDGRFPGVGKSSDKAILDRAAAHLNGMNTYQVKISRIERVAGQLQPEEEIVLSIQRDPKAVRLEWTDGPNKGREVIYSSKLDPRMMFVHVASSPIPIPTMKIAIDSPMVMRNSRHAITEAGFDTIIENLRKATTTKKADDPARDSLKYAGIEACKGLDAPAHHFVRKTTSGETWEVYLDSQTTLPRLVTAVDSRGELVERYLYRDVRENPSELKTASAFVPDQRWGESNGLLSRLARAAAGPSQPTASQSTTR